MRRRGTGETQWRKWKQDQRPVLSQGEKRVPVRVRTRQPVLQKAT